MAVRKSTKRANKPAPDSVAAAAFIAGGGSSPRRKAVVGKVRPKLYVQKSIIERVDEARNPPHRMVGVSQNHWIIEAIVEKLEREEG